MDRIASPQPDRFLHVRPYSNFYEQIHCRYCTALTLPHRNLRNKLGNASNSLSWGLTIVPSPLISRFELAMEQTNVSAGLISNIHLINLTHGTNTQQLSISYPCLGPEEATGLGSSVGDASSWLSEIGDWHLWLLCAFKVPGFCEESRRFCNIHPKWETQRGSLTSKMNTTDLLIAHCSGLECNRPCHMMRY